MSGDVQHFFCCVCAPTPLSEPVRRFSSCSTDFSQRIAQVVLFLFLGRYAVDRKIGLERVNVLLLMLLLTGFTEGAGIFHCISSTHKFI